MKKALIFLILGVLMLGAAAAAAADSGDTAEERRNPLQIQTKMGLSGSLASTYIAPDVTLLYSPIITKNWFAFGGGVKGFYGLNYNDIYVAPYGTVELAWFYFDLGVVMEAKGPDEDTLATSSDEFPAFLSAGFYPRVKAGPGWIVFGANMDLFPTASPVIEEDSVLGTIIATILGAAVNLFKIEAGVGYRLSL
jgi:hypothetical protein